MTKETSEPDPLRRLTPEELAEWHRQNPDSVLRERFKKALEEAEQIREALENVPPPSMPDGRICC